MGNAVVMGISRGRNSSSLLLRRSRGHLPSSSSPIFSAGAPSSFVAGACWLGSRQVLAHFSSSTAGHRSCSTIKEGDSHRKRGGPRDPAMASTTSEQAAPMIEMKCEEEVMQRAASEKMIKKILASALALMSGKEASSVIGRGVGEVMEKVIENNMMEVKRELESVADKLDEVRERLEKLENGHKSRNKAMKKVESGIEDLWRKCYWMGVQVKELKRMNNIPCSVTEDEDRYCESLDRLKEEVKRRKCLEAERN